MKGYRLLQPHCNEIIIRRDVKFDENILACKPNLAIVPSSSCKPSSAFVPSYDLVSSSDDDSEDENPPPPAHPPPDESFEPEPSPAPPLLLHIIFFIPMTVNDVNLYVSFRGVSGLSS